MLVLVDFVSTLGLDSSFSFTHSSHEIDRLKVTKEEKRINALCFKYDRLTSAINALSAYDPDEIEEEQRERERKNRTNLDF
ncbi:hypothetical protein Scep_019604 [Stephania cephalantha]|uniref:Uncharacterized protein n=1 Tax=Stephania cephalantha TaxID=152367 RepID=A0AAP0IB76_9MAGN